MAGRKTVRSRRLGRRLKALRESAGISQEALAATVSQGCAAQVRLTQSALSRVESGLARLGAEQLARIIRAVGADPAAAAGLEELRARADERGWWQDWSHLITELAEMATELEEEAGTIRTYDAVFVQGLVQTEGYARTVIESSRAFVRPHQVDTFVELRMRRQRRLAEPSFGTLTVVLTEASLHHAVGGRLVMTAQLAKLCQIGEERRHAIHVLPYARGPWPGVASFALYGFPHPDDGEVGHVDGDLGAQLYEDREPISALNYMFHAALAQALPASESLDLIHTVMKEM
ncbi:MAG: helix-turn-helix domain-containing protein [Pseudonocardiaceae bacterium]